MKRRSSSIRKAARYALSMGPTWVLFRLGYESKRRLGALTLLDRRVLAEVGSLPPEKFTLSAITPFRSTLNGDPNAVEEADRAMNGVIRAFSSKDLNYNGKKGLDWTLNPLTGLQAPSNLPWHRIPDFGAFGDIKIIWEASRFPQILSFVQAFHATGDDKYARACIAQILDWIDKNPYPLGPHYKCGQETTFRLIAWTLALTHFSKWITSEERQRIAKVFYASAFRIEGHIDFAMKSVRNNHSISESTGLILCALLCENLPRRGEILRKGIRFLEHELSYQVFEDGSYIQHSFNYQRLVLDTVSFAILLLRAHSVDVSLKITQFHEKMLRFLNSFVQENGELPNYGANDGAYLFPVRSSPYTDFRPSLNLASQTTLGHTLFSKSHDLTDLFFENTSEVRTISKLDRMDSGGYYLLRNKRSFLFTRSHTYQTRPGHCDVHHIDFWLDGKNIFTDSGTYSYRAEAELRPHFEEMMGHNTVTINHLNPMDRAGAFGWTNWIRAKLNSYSSNSLSVTHSGYQSKFNIDMLRNIELTENGFSVSDTPVFQKGKASPVTLTQHWNTPLEITQIDSHQFQAGSLKISSNTPGRIEQGYFSRHYLELTKTNRLVFEGSDPIITHAEAMVL